MSAEKIAVIGGTGDLGLGLALRWGRAGARVLIGSRDENKAKQAAEKVVDLIGKDVPSVSVTGFENAAAAAQASVVVLAVPITAQVSILKSIRGSIKNAILVDATVPFGGRNRRGSQLGCWKCGRGLPRSKREKSCRRKRTS